MNPDDFIDRGGLGISMDAIYRQLGRSIEVEVDIDDVEPPAPYDGDLD